MHPSPDAPALTGVQRDVALARAAPLELPVAPPTPPPPRAHGRRVLIVDDETGILSSLQRLLRREDYELVTAQNGIEALQLLEERPAYVIITDYRMPGMTGTELLREVQSRWPHTLRIVLTGYSEVKAIIAAINDGAVYKFITKPWNDEEIRLHVRRAVEQYELEMENRRMAREIFEQNQRLLELNRLLDQRATDATVGQNLAQSLHEVIAAGVITVDEGGLIVGANRRASDVIFCERRELIGMPASLALPEPLYAAFCSNEASEQSQASGRVELEGRTLQWRSGWLMEQGVHRGRVVTLWEEVQCPQA